MAGGKGTRFWPLSRSVYAKQFLDLIDNKSLVQHTIDRLEGFIPTSQQWVVTNESQAHLFESTEILKERLLCEPVGRNTCPCIGWAALECLQVDPDAIMVVLPSDHMITQQDRFQAVVQDGIKLVNKTDHLVTIGINPTHPHTGYGYIKTASDSSLVEAFTEKPNYDTAKQFIASKSYYWNAGLFIWKAATILECIKSHSPDTYEVLMAIKSLDKDTSSYKTDLASLFQSFPNISIDYAILEKAIGRIAMIKSTFDWSDVGNWSALEDFLDKDSDNNAKKAQVLALDSHNNIVVSDKPIVALVDIENLIVIDTEDALLVLPKESDQKIKQLYEKLPNQFR